MTITSSAFQNNAMIPTQYTCDGGNTNPAFEIHGVPPGAKSLAFIMDDPDAPNGTFVHWVMFGMPPTTTLISTHSVPPNTREGLNGTGKSGYIGPCPPSGTHHYFFKLYALDTDLDFGKAPMKADLEHAMEGHIITQAELIGLYKR